MKAAVILASLILFACTIIALHNMESVRPFSYPALMFELRICADLFGPVLYLFSLEWFDLEQYCKDAFVKSRMSPASENDHRLRIDTIWENLWLCKYRNGIAVGSRHLISS